MAMGTRQQRERQQGLWIPAADIRRGGGHPFYQRLNSLLDEEGVDRFVEGKVRTRATRPRWGGRWPRPGNKSPPHGPSGPCVKTATSATGC